jgi:hypoxanthine phosphoribosyltransferase
MAVAMNKELADKAPIFLCVVIGGLVPLGNLLPRLDFPLEVDYAHVSRYGQSFQGNSIIQWKSKPSHDLKDRTIVIVDDILDEGLTLAEVFNYCQKEGAKEILNAVLIDKKKPRKPGGVEVADFVGLEIDDRFVFGYGLDYHEYLRNAPGIYAAAPEHIKD